MPNHAKPQPLDPAVPPPPPPYNPPPLSLNFNLDGDYNGYVHRSSTYDLNSKIMLTAIISLSVVVVLVIVLHIYARCVLRRQARDRAIIRRLGVATATPEPPKTGLDPLVIASLPIFVYKAIHVVDQEENSDQECAVCLSNLEDQEMARFLPNCKHTFHAECIDKWLSSHSTCPICRTEARPWIQPVPREGPVAAAVAPPLERVCIEGTSSENGNQSSTSNKGGGPSVSRLSSFRRILSRERSSRRIQYEIQEHGFEDLERQ